MIKLIPLIIPEVNWGSYVPLMKLLNKQVEYDPTLLGFYKSLKQIRDSEVILKHINIGFLIVSFKDFFLHLMEHQDVINILLIPGDQFYGCIATSNILNWKHFVLMCSDGDESSNIRYLANLIHQYLESIGFHHLFLNCGKIGLDDGTFKLLRRKS